jgi:hypothetical protein
LAANDFEPNHAFRVGSAWGVQFHPEFDTAAMDAYLAHLAPTLQAAGRRQNNCVRNCARHRKRRQYYSVLPACCRNRLPERAAGRASAALAEIN